MPRHSERASRIRQLNGWIVRHLRRQRKKFSTFFFVHHFDVNEVTSTVSPFVHHLYRRLKILRSSRYLHERPRGRPRLADHAPAWQFDSDILSDRQYRTLYRMSKESFTALLRLIEPHEIFYNNSRCPQKPPKTQLQVALYHFGGGGTSRIRTSIQFAIAEGTVYLYTHRVTVALLSLQKEYINWPAPHSAEYKKLWNDIISCTAFPIALDSLMELPYQYIVNQSRMESVITPERVITDSIQQLLLIVQLKFYL